MFLAGKDNDSIRRTVEDVKRQASEQGRDLDHNKTIVGISIIVDETNEKAGRKYEKYLSYADLEGSLTLFGG
jgi:alkanesulfonate monooxygenase SsuD/methylene tetrahydromethanopterin reductase-like flavin-dependent oxidoreductase (luciferase family)